MNRAEERAMRIAISTDGQMVAPHFGRCEAYTIVDLEDGQVKGQERLPNPGHEPGFLPGYLAEQGVTCIVAGGMGHRAQMLFDQHDIRTIIGVTGTVAEAVAALAEGKLEGGESLCEH
jgi:predicted Fe-Mo cluster-binding NifX family protein